MSNIQREPESPGRELLMAILGPVTSLVLGGIFLLIGSLIVGPIGTPLADPEGVIAELGPAAAILLWLGAVNILVGAFNLIPGFPLDGGRVLRSALWAITDNLRRATRWASWVGQGIAWLMIAAGVSMAVGVQIPFFGTGLINGLWLVFIGWFLNSASAQSYRQVVIRDILIPQVDETEFTHLSGREPSSCPVAGCPPPVMIQGSTWTFPWGTTHRSFVHGTGFNRGGSR